jgi:hypothetical protein
MTPEVFAEWLRRQGYKVVQTPSSYWAQLGPRVLQAIPYHQSIEPSFDELNDLLKEHRAISLRYSAPWSASTGMASYHVVLTRNDYSLLSIPKKARYDVRRGMADANIEPITFTMLADEGWQLRVDTLQRQGRVRAETLQYWQRLCQSADGLAGFETWGTLIKGRLVASLVAFTMGDCCSILYQQSLTDYLSLGVNNALAYVFTTDVLKRPGNPWIFYGLHSLDAPPSVDEFKFRMGYTAKPVRQRVVFHPWMRPLMNTASHALLQASLYLKPGDPTLSKAEGMLRFYLQGRLPLSRQAMPQPLK